MEQFNILVCDDDRSIVEAIEIYLKQENYHVIKAYNGLEALEALEENEIHLILMDVMMPLLDGLNTTVKIRESMNIPIIILSAKTEDTDKILGLNFGADDYISKPFNPLELLARIKSQMRRYTMLGSIAEKSNVIRIGELELDKDAKEVRVGGEPIKLTATEYGILQLLMENKGKTVTRERLLTQIWDNHGNYVNNNTLTVTMKRLREKLHHPSCLKTIRSFGYRMEDEI